MATRPPRELPTRRILGGEGEEVGSAVFSFLLGGLVSEVAGAAVVGGVGGGGVVVIMVC